MRFSSRTERRAAIRWWSAGVGCIGPAILYRLLRGWWHHSSSAIGAGFLLVSPASSLLNWRASHQDTHLKADWKATDGSRTRPANPFAQIVE